MFKEYLKAIGLEPVEKMERHGHVIPVRPRKGPFAKNRVFLVGDAAGFADPILAEGISFAIRSGQMAATAILEGGFDVGQSQSLYNKAISWKILPELWIGRRIAPLLYNFPKIRAMLFKATGKQLSGTMMKIFLGESTYFKTMFNPLNHLIIWILFLFKSVTKLGRRSQKKS